jgi:HAD superfamily hydrolase (TIGR01509 family)
MHQRCPPSAPDLVIFDCDGVLIDSELIGCGVDAQELTRAGIPITAEELLARFAGTTSREMYAALEVEHGIRLPETFARLVRERTDTAFAGALEPVPGVLEVLDRLQLPRCVASSSTMRRLGVTLRLTALWDRFAPHVYSAEAVPRGKPAPDLFLHVAACMDVEPERCLVIEDSINGVRAAVAAGMRAFGFSGASHCPPDHHAALSAAGAAVVFTEMRALPELIETGGGSAGTP